MSAEWSTMAGFLPPSSSVTGVRCARRGGHHQTPDPAAAGEEDVVPALLEKGAGHRRATFGHGYRPIVKVGRQQLGE